MTAPGQDDDTAPQPVLRFDDLSPAAPATAEPPRALHRSTPPPRRRRHALVVAAVTAAVVAIGAAGYAITRQSPAAATPTAPYLTPGATPAPSQAAAAPLASDDADPLKPSRDTLVLGDSLALIVYPWLADLLPDRYVSYVAEVGSSAGWARQQLEDMRARGDRIPKVVLISAGTNDFSAEDFRRDAAAILDLLGPKRCVAWSTVSRPDVINGEQVDPASDLDRVLDDLAASHPNLTLIDWAGLVDKHPDWLAGDGLHPIEEGAIARAKQFAAASKACSPLDPDAPVADKQYLPDSAFYPGGSTTDTSGSGAAYGSSDTTGSTGSTHATTPTRQPEDKPSERGSRPPRSRPTDDAGTPPKSGGEPGEDPTATAPAEPPAPQETAPKAQPSAPA